MELFISHSKYSSSSYKFIYVIFHNLFSILASFERLEIFFHVYHIDPFKTPVFGYLFIFPLTWLLYFFMVCHVRDLIFQNFWF